MDPVDLATSGAQQQPSPLLELPQGGMEILPGCRHHAEHLGGDRQLVPEGRLSLLTGSQPSVAVVRPIGQGSFPFAQAGDLRLMCFLLRSELLKLGLELRDPCGGVSHHPSPTLPWGPCPLRIALIGCDVVRRTIFAGPRPDVPTAPATDALLHDGARIARTPEPIL